MRLLKPSNNFIQIVLMRWINQAFMLRPQTWVRLITLKKQPNIQNIFSRSEKNYHKIIFFKWSPHNFELDFGSKFLDKLFVKALYLKSFLVCNFWKIWFSFLLTDPSVQKILTCYQAYLWSSKRCRTKFWYIWIPYSMGYKL